MSSLKDVVAGSCELLHSRVFLREDVCGIKWVHAICMRGEVILLGSVMWGVATVCSGLLEYSKHIMFPIHVDYPCNTVGVTRNKLCCSFDSATTSAIHFCRTFVLVPC